MTTFTYRQRAGQDAKFMPGAFDANIGKTIRVNLPDGGTTAGKVLKAEVVEDGQAALITIEVDGEIPDVSQSAQPFSFGFKVPE